MGNIKVMVDDKVEERFRRVAMKKFGYGRGALSTAAEAALAQWSSKEDIEEVTLDELDDPVAAIEGLLKHATESSVELQHKASRIRVKKTLGHISH
ncbi:MAG TPA: hypothetical protein VIH03_09385 [Nitrososphaerales archaeon]